MKPDDVLIVIGLLLLAWALAHRFSKTNRRDIWE